MSTFLPISYGPGLPDDSELRLCGDVNGRRVVELGASGGAAIAFAQRGAKAIVLDPSAAALAAVRQRASEMGDDREIRVECHAGDYADLGFAPSASVDLVFSAGALGSVDDLARVLRQAHRVLKPDTALVCSLPHPFAAVLDGTTVVRRYGTAGRTISELFMALTRANFALDVLAEPDLASAPAGVPPMLVLRARKLGV
jgi:SAM-dependent methyltransferase